MCAAALPWLIAGLGVASAASGLLSSPSQAAPTIQTYQAAAAPSATAAPEAPAASPVMVAQGASEADDEQGATDPSLRRQREGRNRLRIDRITDENQTGGLGGGSGVVVPS